MVGAGVIFALVFVIGAGAQFIDGSLGMGFGFFSSSLMLVAGFTPATVSATVNVAKVTAGVLSGLSHWGVGNVRRDWLLPLILPGVGGAGFGAYLVSSLPADVIRFWVSVVLVGMGVVILWRAASPRWMESHQSPENVKRSPSHVFLLGAIGLIGGFLNGLIGAFGPFTTPALILAQRALPSEAVGTVSLAEIFVASAAVATFSAAGMTALSWDVMLALILGGAVTAPLAARFCRWAPARILSLGVGILLIALNLVVAVWALRAVS